jgi:hypothetical protein
MFGPIGLRRVANTRHGVPRLKKTRPAREVDAVLVELADIERRAAVHLESAPPKIVAD